MRYEGKCPNCGTVVRRDSGTLKKSIATPICTCSRCGEKYLDENMYEWAVLNPLYKLFFFFFANQRWLVTLTSLIATIGFMMTNFAIGFLLLVGMLIWMLVCFLYVQIRYEAAIKVSEKRCEDKEYVTFLNIHNGFKYSESYRAGQGGIKPLE